MERMHWLVAAAIVLAAPAASAQIVTTITAAPGQSIKTPPLAQSDSFVLRIDTHIPQDNFFLLGWTGALVKVHLLDNTEADVVSTHAPFFRNRLGPPNGPVISPSVSNSSPFGPPSANLQSVPVSFNIYETTPVSGIDVTASQLIRIASARIHAKNTTSPAQNSDIDATVMLWNIYHIRNTFTAGLASSVLRWMTSQGVSPAFSLGDPAAHWIHNATTAQAMRRSSSFVASFVGTIHVGIEHVPEPATGGLLAGGLLALAGSRLARRHRLNLMAETG